MKMRATGSDASVTTGKTTVPAMPSAQPVILVVDDIDACRLTMKWFLSNFNYSVETARSAEEATALFNPKVHTLVLTDNSMPGMTGADLAQFVKERSPSTLVFMYTGKPPADRRHLDLVMQKPTHLLVIKEALDKLLRSATKEEWLDSAEPLAVS